ncbi:TonB-dependent receptor [Sphingorhabdus contaminans]|uniref:TonB-dependent receptor n=1 Tax=Sphingorhabdus contaminans TaxID=1343899 RepID=A0A553WAF4_9SPHN|nr:TonB-dependent receptor [Sphingorhabdus contaminans]TSB01670.1 TonB-dependent receptor [Sphingorhabdus contaminans]
MGKVKQTGARASWLLAGAALVSVLLASPVFAQDNEAVAEEGEGEILVVGVRKRDEEIQTVPISITAYSAEGLAERNISNFADLGNATPGLNVTSIAGGTTQQIFVRGLAPANTTTDLNVEANVGTFIDGIYQTSRNTLDMISVLDVGQIEIAKGPQSALFGRSTFAGALSIATRRPARDFEGNISATVGVDEDYRIRGSVSVPLGDKAAIRISGGYLTYDGWGKNAADTSDNLGGTEKYAISGSLQLKPSDNFTATLSGFLTHSETEMTPVTQVPITAFNCGTTNATLGLRQQVCGGLTASKVSNLSTDIPDTLAKARQVSMELDWELDGVRIVSTTGLTRASNRAYNDYDGTSAGVTMGVCGLGAGCLAFAPFFGAPVPYTRLTSVNLYSTGLEKVKTFSQEIRLQSANDSPFQWILGGNYFEQKIPVAAGGIGADSRGLAANERLVQVNPLTFPATGVGGYDFTANGFLTTNPSSGQLFSSWSKASTKTMSIFASLGYEFGNLRVNAEGRYNIDRKRAQVFSVSNPTVAPNVNQLIVGTTVPAAGLFPVTGPLIAKTFESFAPRVTLDFKAADDVLLYASASKGVRSGGFNTANAVSTTGILASEVAYDEEANWTYEAGIKSQWMDKKLLVNLSAFYVDWTNAQVSSFTENPTAVNPVRIIRNIGGIKTKGFEALVEVKPIEMLGIGGSVTFSDVEFGAGTYDGGTVTQCVIGTGAAATAAPGCPPVIVVTTPSGAVRAVPSIEGLRPARSVELQWNLHATLDAPISDEWNASARVDVNHTGPSFNNIINTITFGNRTLTNVRLGFSNDRFSIALWGNNIFNKVYAANAINQPRAGLPVSFVVPEVYLGELRRFGVTASAKF